MLIEIHMLQNHSPSNLNRDDLGAPKTCFFGGVIRSRISSQSLKRSIRMSDEFKELLGGIRTRRLAELIAQEIDKDKSKQKHVEEILNKCGIKSSETKKKKSEDEEDDNDNDDEKKDTKMLVYTTREAIRLIAEEIKNLDFTKKDIHKTFAEIIANNTAVPDIALSGRMLEPGKTELWKHYNTTVEASLQVAHAISTHEAHPEVDYFIASDDIPGDDAGAGYLDEAMFTSACFYKYFSINWEQLVYNLKGNIKLALHTVGAFLRGAAISNPSGKQNSFASHNPPDCILVEIKNYPTSYANAFVEPVKRTTNRNIIEQSIAQLSQYVKDIRIGYGEPLSSIWFSPNNRYSFYDVEELNSNQINVPSLDELTSKLIDKLSNILKLGINWQEAKEEILDENNRLNTLVVK